jgi:integrase
MSLLTYKPASCYLLSELINNISFERENIMATVSGFKGISSRKLSSGTKYRFQVSYRGEKYSSPSIYDTPVQAEIAKREKLIEMELTHSRADSQPLALSELVSRRVQDLQIKRTQKYVYHSEWYFEKMVDELGAGTSVLTITKPLMVKLLNKEASRLIAEGKGLHSVNQQMAIYKAFFNYCIEDLGITMINPVVGIKQYSVTQKEKYIPPYEHIMRVREQVLPHQRNLIDFLIQTGSRISSALWLTVDSIKWKDKRIALFTSKSRHGDHAPYIIPLPEILWDMRKDGSLPEEGRVFYQWKELSHPNFLYLVIKKINDNKIKSEWADSGDDYNYDYIEPFSYHAFRHRCATEWVNSGMSLREVQLRLGHSSYGMTERYISKLIGYDFTKFEDDIFTEF